MINEPFFKIINNFNSIFHWLSWNGFIWRRSFTQSTGIVFYDIYSNRNLNLFSKPVFMDFLFKKSLVLSLKWLLNISNPMIVFINKISLWTSTRNVMFQILYFYCEIDRYLILIYLLQILALWNDSNLTSFIWRVSWRKFLFFGTISQFKFSYDKLILTNFTFSQDKNELFTVFQSFLINYSHFRFGYYEKLFLIIFSSFWNWKVNTKEFSVLINCYKF